MFVRIGGCTGIFLKCGEMRSAVLFSGLRFLFPLPHGVAEVPQLSPQRKIFAVGICHQAALLQVQLSLAVQIGFLHIDTGDLGEKTVCVPISCVAVTLHSRLTGHSCIIGTPVALPSVFVSFSSLNLSTSRPDFTPQKSHALTVSLPTRLITKVPRLDISS